MTDDLVTIREAAALLRGRGGKPPSPATVYAWAGSGCRPHPGLPAVVLRTMYLGRSLVTRRSWIAEFEAERDRLHVRGIAPRVDVAPRSRKASIKRAARILDEAGIR